MTSSTCVWAQEFTPFDSPEFMAIEQLWETVEHDKAMKKIQELRTRAEGSKDIRTIAYCDYYEGLVHTEWGEYEKAKSMFNRSKEQFLAIKDEIGFCFSEFGTAYVLTCQAEMKKAVPLIESILAGEYINHVLKLKGRFNTVSAICYYWLADHEKGFEVVEKARTIQNKESDLYWLNMTKVIEGRLTRTSGKIAEARILFEAAIKQCKKSRYISPYLWAMKNLAYLEYRAGDLEAAEPKYQEVVDTALPLNLKRILHFGYQGLGNVYSVLSKYSDSLIHYEQALKLRKELNTKRGIASTLECIGSVYLSLGKTEKAKDLLLDSVRLYEEGGYFEMVFAYEHLGQYYYLKNNPEKVRFYGNKIVDYTKNSLKQYLQIGYRIISKGYALENNLEKEIFYLKKAIEISEKYGLKRRLTISQNLIGSAYSKKKDFDNAEEHFEKALEIAIAIGLENETWKAHFGLGSIYNQQGNIEKAYDELEKAVESIEKITGWLHEGYNIGQFIEDKREVYYTFLEVLFKLYKTTGVPVYGTQIYEVLQRMDQFELSDSFIKEGHKNIKDPEFQKILEAYKSKKAEITIVEKKIISSKSKGDSKKLKQLVETLASKREEFKKITNDIIGRYPRFNTLFTEINPINMVRARKRMDKNNLWITYFATKEQLYLFLVGKNVCKIKSVPVPKDKINGLIVSYLHNIKATIEDLVSGTSRRQYKVRGWSDSELKNKKKIKDLKKIITTIYGYLIKPIEEEIEPYRYLTITPTGYLHYFPFASLGQESEDEYGEKRMKFLVEDKIINYVPTPLYDSYEPKGDAFDAEQSKIILFGPPQKSNLRFSDKEIDKIEKVFPRCRIFKEESSTEGKFKDESRDASLIHLSTHGILKKDDPWSSYLMLGSGKNEDGHLTFAEIMELDLLQVGLIVLSACETALGSEEIPGGQITSLASAFGTAEVSTIVATLWSVDDLSTSVLMSNFYKKLRTMGKGEALREAQLELLKRPMTAHPFFWAPFILMGNYH